MTSPFGPNAWVIGHLGFVNASKAVDSTVAALAMIRVKSALDTWWDLAGMLSGGILVLAMLFLLWQVSSIRQSVQAVADNALPSIEATGDISQLRLRYRVRSLEMLLAATPEEQAKLANGSVYSVQPE